MKHFNHKNLTGFASFVFVFLLSFRKLFFIKGIPGHNWDWAFPYPQFMFQNLNLPTKFIWWGMDLGSNSGLSISHFYPDTILSLLAYYLNPHQVIIVLFFFLLFFSFIFSKIMFDKIVGKNFLNFFPSLLYAYSPFLFNDIIGGSWYMWISYAAAPLFFVQMLKFAETGKIINLAVLLVSGIFVISSLQHFIIIELFILLYLIYRDKTIFNKCFRRYLFSHLVLLIFNLYWVLPFASSLASFKESVFTPSFIQDFQGVNYSKQGIWNILSLVGYLDRNMYFYVFSGFALPVFLVSVLFLWIKIIFSFLKPHGEKKELLFWIILLLISMIFIKGGNPPFSGLTMTFFEKFPLLRLYRSPQHMMFATAFIIPVLLALVLKLEGLKKDKLILGLVILSVFFWISGWWTTGDLGHRSLLSQKKDHVDFFSLPPDIEKIYQLNYSEVNDNRYFFLPAAFSVNFLKNKYQNIAQGGIPEYMYLPSPVFTSSYNSFADFAEKSFFSADAEFDLVSYLSRFSVDKIILRKDVEPSFTSSKDVWDFQKVRDSLDSNKKLTKIFEGEFASVYQINKEYYLPHFYAPKNILTSLSVDEILSEVMKENNYDIRSVVYRDEKKYSNHAFANLDTLAKSEFENFENVIYEYKTVKHEPGTWDWWLILIKEALQELRLINDPENLINLEMKFANKRMVEVEKYGIRDSVNDQIRIYTDKINRGIESLGKISDSNKKYLSYKVFRNNILFNLQTLKEINENKKDKGITQWINEVIKLLERLEKTTLVVPEIEPLKVNYKIDILSDGNFTVNLKIKENDGQDTIESYRHANIIIDDKLLVQDIKESDLSGWLQFGRIELKEKKGANLTIDYSKSDPLGLEDVSAYEKKILNWKPDTWYFLSGNAYLTTGNVKLTLEELIEDGSGNIVNLVSRQAIVSLNDSSFRFYVKTNAKSLGARIILEPLINEDKFRKGSNLTNILVYPLYTPEIILKTKDLPLKENIPTVSFTRVNPTKYLITFEKVREPFTLVFNENFSDGWKLSVANNASINIWNLLSTVGSWFTGNIFKEKRNDLPKTEYFQGEIKEGNHQMDFINSNTFKDWGREIIAEENHVKVNGYANGWRLTPEDFKNQDSGKLILEFFPQRYLYLGIVLDFVIGLILLSILIKMKLEKSS